MKKGPENIQLKSTIVLLERTATKNKAQIWNKAAFLLAKPTRSRVEANLFEIDRATKAGDTVLVPGKVLSQGEMTHSITLAAWKISAGAKAKLAKAGCKTMSIKELVEKNGKGSKVVFIV